MPGSIEKHMPGSSGCASPSTMYGGSCVVSPMPWPVRVDEVLAVAGVRNHLPRRPVDVLAGDARAHGLVAGLLRALHDLVHPALLVGGLADVDGARRVGAISVLRA